MQFFYGNYTHANNSVAFDSISRTFIRGATQRQHLLRISWNIRGKIVDAVQANIWGELNAILAAYQTDGASCGFNGTPFVINGKLAIGGVRVTSPVSFGDISGAEGVTYLRYKVGLEADFLWALPNDILEFSETTSFTDNGGQPIYVERLPQNAPPLLQQVTQSSWYFGTQSGKLVQPGPNPTPMLPLLGPFLRTSQNNAQQITYTSPKTIRGTPIEYGVQWKYEYISAYPMVIYPNALG